MIYQGGYYYFDKNTLGDVIAIRDEYGDVVARYTYDAWGNIIDQDGEMAEMNPFRYRGYYYDTETGFYYLQTRYYDPTICRFINADNYELVADLASVPGQLNMYAYCNNNPIMYTDPTGLWIETVFDLFSLGVSVVEVVINPANPWAWAGLVGDAVDLLPFVTGVGEGVKATKLVKYADDMYDATLATVRITKAVDFTSDALGTMKTLDRVGDFTQSSLSAGRRIHQGYKLGLPGKEFSGVSGMRMDFFDGTNIFELKPYNRNSLRRGINQLLRYNNGLGGGYIMILEFY